MRELGSALVRAMAGGWVWLATLSSGVPAELVTWREP